jgi:protein-L-isoaspartate(D-aspartate) O-methyltransferase
MAHSTADTRQFFADDLRVLCNLRSPRLIEALASVPRERFLPPGPWLVRGVYDADSRTTEDANPRSVYHDFAIAVDPARNLYNGQPSLIARWLDGLAIAEGHRVLHIGCGTGYFTAIIGHLVGPTGRVFAIDVDPDLAARARANLADRPWIETAAGDGRSGLPGDVDVVLVHAGATHVLDEWLDASRDGCRLLVPLTAVIPGLPTGIGKGMVLTARRSGDGWTAALSSMVAIYSLVGLRDEARAAALGQVLLSGKGMTVKRVRRDPHEPGPACVLHGATTCLAS